MIVSRRQIFLRQPIKLSAVSIISRVITDSIDAIDLQARLKTKSINLGDDIQSSDINYELLSKSLYDSAITIDVEAAYKDILASDSDAVEIIVDALISQVIGGLTIARSLYDDAIANDIDIAIVNRARTTGDNAAAVDALLAIIITGAIHSRSLSDSIGVIDLEARYRALTTAIADGDIAAIVTDSMAITITSISPRGQIFMGLAHEPIYMALDKENIYMRLQ